MSFCAEARRWFDPIGERFDLNCVSSSESNVRYENARVVLLVTLDRRGSGELGVEIGRRSDRYPGPPFSLGEILRLRGVEDAVVASGTMIGDEARLPALLSRLADLTNRHASDFLAGNEFSFSQAQSLRNRESADFERRSRIATLRSRAEVAWRARDYEAVVNALDPIEDQLSPADRLKLDHCRKRLVDP